MLKFKVGDRVILRKLTPELKSDGFHVGEVGMVRSLNGKLALNLMSVRMRDGVRVCA